MSGKSLFRSDVPDVVIRSIFDKYDKDGSKVLERPEILALLGDMGLDEQQAELCFLMMDKDGNNNVSKDEFLQWFQKGEGAKVVDDPNRFAFVQKVANTFKRYDRDGSGAIDKHEFRALLASSGKNWQSCTDAQIEAALRVVDKDGSGTVSFSAFLNWMDKLNANRK